MKLEKLNFEGKKKPNLNGTTILVNGDELKKERGEWDCEKNKKKKEREKT